MPQIADTSPRDWRYVSEGGATIVFSYIGPSGTQFDNTVLRLRKSPLSVNSMPVDVSLDDPMVEFQQRCTSRLIPPVHLPRLKSIMLDKEWIEGLTAWHNDTRPEERRTKDTIDVTRTRAVLATNLVGSDWIAVEIKPKWGFLPSPKHLSPETYAIKTKTCRFCMLSRVRASQGEAQAVGYCPLDLFSGEEGRMRRAISNLWDAWMVSGGGINNLKIFVRGSLIKPSEAGTMWQRDNNVAGIGDMKESFISAIVPMLLHTPVLRKIASLQRSLDPFDIEGLSKLWSNAENDSVFSEPTMDEWDEFVSKSSEMDQLDHPDPDLVHLRYYILAYLLSATFKDCSIIVRLDYPGSPSIARVEPAKVSVIDLDKKSVSRLETWERLDREIAESYTKLGQDKTCATG